MSDSDWRPGSLSQPESPTGLIIQWKSVNIKSYCRNNVLLIFEFPGFQASLHSVNSRREIRVKEWWVRESSPRQWIRLWVLRKDKKEEMVDHQSIKMIRTASQQHVRLVKTLIFVGQPSPRLHCYILMYIN